MLQVLILAATVSIGPATVPDDRELHRVALSTIGAELGDYNVARILDSDDDCVHMYIVDDRSFYDVVRRWDWCVDVDYPAQVECLLESATTEFMLRVKKAVWVSTDFEPILGDWIKSQESLGEIRQRPPTRAEGIATIQNDVRVSESSPEAKDCIRNLFASQERLFNPDAVKISWLFENESSFTGSATITSERCRELGGEGFGVAFAFEFDKGVLSEPQDLRPWVVPPTK